ncbi:hypothetical protein E4U17_005002 [Claviceps sp. LM77 group G4]|nr:hypothetical protein E4U17_005002 [Claviceps sp. LM77 group G4]KAG6064734.1 hypothetical protein E4U33_006049 [Claviceps sp. LM78 group G4]KAG6070671.1 hypothetical protein E4U16_006688 [Claviceps sp. LM84 group G4]
MFRSRVLPRVGKSLGLGLRTTVNARRCLHRVPALPHDYSQGVPNLMSRSGFQIAWTENMSMLLEKLNALTVGTELENHDTKTIALLTAREPSQAPIFNYASMAHNNHFFFQGIAPEGTPMSNELRAGLEASFSSIESLRLEFIMTAAAMFGPGFVWLVRCGPANYRLLTTYLAGSPYPGAHWRAQSTDMNTVGNEGSGKPYMKNQSHGSMRPRGGGDLPPGGINAEPLLCLNTWEHAWLFDWGVGARGQGGKVPYIESWWNLIDWEKISNNCSSRPFK